MAGGKRKEGKENGKEGVGMENEGRKGKGKGMKKGREGEGAETPSSYSLTSEPWICMLVVRVVVFACLLNSKNHRTLQDLLFFGPNS